MIENSDNNLAPRLNVFVRDSVYSGYSRPSSIGIGMGFECDAKESVGTVEACVGIAGEEFKEALSVPSLGNFLEEMDKFGERILKNYASSAVLTSEELQLVFVYTSQGGKSVLSIVGADDVNGAPKPRSIVLGRTSDGVGIEFGECLSKVAASLRQLLPGTVGLTVKTIETRLVSTKDMHGV